jgi:O-acetylserine/cysteine efflux transporter
MAIALEGWEASVAATASAGIAAWAAVAWQVVGNMLFGYVAWSWLLLRYDAAIITPYALLIPVFGMGASAFWLGEPLPPWKFAAGALVLGGIMIIIHKGKK